MLVLGRAAQDIALARRLCKERFRIAGLTVDLWRLDVVTGYDPLYGVLDPNAFADHADTFYVALSHEPGDDIDVDRQEQGVLTTINAKLCIAHDELADADLAPPKPGDVVVFHDRAWDVQKVTPASLFASGNDPIEYRVDLISRSDFDPARRLAGE